METTRRSVLLGIPGFDTRDNHGENPAGTARRHAPASLLHAPRPGRSSRGGVRAAGGARPPSPPPLGPSRGWAAPGRPPAPHWSGGPAEKRGGSGGSSGRRDLGRFRRSPPASRVRQEDTEEKTFQLLHLFYPYESLRRRVMSTAALIHLVRNGGYQVRRRALLTSRLLQDEKRTTAECCISTYERRASRFDSDGSGRPATWDTFGIWDNRIDEPILLPPSIKYGKPIPKVNLSKVGCASHIGKRKENEDRFDYAQLTEDVLYFAVYDGHGGAAAADFCAKNMERCIKEFAAQEENLEKVLNDAFLEINKAYERHAQLSADATLMNSGTTATVALLRDGIELVVASVGDSRALLCRKGKAMKLTIDHTPERKEEKERIRKCGGFVAWNSLGQPHVNGRLAMTRSIGDLELKNSGVIAQPETKRVQLHHADDGFLVLTTDGINFMVNSQEICDFINQCHDPAEAAHVVTEQAIQYGTEDNSTVVIVPFGAWGKYKNGEINFSFSRSFASSGRWA